MDWLSFAANLVNRIPIEKVLFPPRDRTKAKEASLEQTATSTITPQETEAGPRQEDIATACVPCALGHFA